MTNPREHDPRFPDRPQHEDFYLLSEIVQEHDQQAEVTSADVFKIAGVDQESAIYTITQRLGLFTEKRGIRLNREAALAGMGMWLDGFAAGVAFNQRRNSDTETGNAGDKEGSS